jgi:DNA ligase-1
VIEVVFNRGIHLPELDFWLDPWDAKESAFVSHAHADHFARHGQALCSSLTAKLLRARFGMAEARLEGVDFGQMIERDGFRLRMLPAGHIAGSAMLHVTRKKDGATLLYTGDFKARRGRTTEPVNFLQADTLIMETTFGLPNLVFPSAMEVDALVLRFVQDALTDGETPVLFGYSLGKAQEALALLAENGIPALSHPKVAEMTEACRAAGICLPEPRVFEGFAIEGHVVVAPPNAVSAKLLRGLKNKRTAMLTGWALQPGSLYRYRVDEVIPMSDHADHAGLHECVTRVRPKRVLTVHGYAKEFAAELRAKGIDAWCAMGGDQLELSLGKSHLSSLGAATPRHIRPICQLADFSDVCRLIGETSSRLAKIDYLVAYLRGLDGEDLETATRWLTGEALPRRAGRRSLNVGSATIKRALISVPGVKPERYQEISAGQNDIARTARIILQEVTLSPKPCALSDLRCFFADLNTISGSLEKVEFLSRCLIELHPSEGELVVKLLTGDLRIGLKEGLVEEAVGTAFQAHDADVRQANMLTGDLGRTAVLAKEGRLSEAVLTPLVPIRCMLAAPLERDESDDKPKFADLPFTPPFWLEPKYDGIRAQLHKLGCEVGLFSRDLRPLDKEFPELIAAAAAMVGDFVLDGELIAYAEGRKLGFADLQKRLGRRKVEGDLFMESPDGAASVPLKYVAFDLLWADGESMLEAPLRERRERLEKIPLEGMFGRIEVFRANDAGEVDAFFKAALKQDHEGLIAKDRVGIYSPGKRGKSWIKLKGVMPTLDCVVTFAEQGHGRRADVLSDYTFSVRDEVSGDLKVLGKAYSGLTDAEIEALTDHFRKHTLGKERRKHRVEPNVVLEIAFDSIRRSPRHDSGLALRFPRIKAIRHDKTLADIDSLQAAENLLKHA